MSSADRPGSPLNLLISKLAWTTDLKVAELTAMLRAIAARGFVRTLRAGPTGVGMTLETLLGIPANPNRAPDYFGIEIKSTRVGEDGKAKSRSTLFAQVPDWQASAVRSSFDLALRYGVVRDGYANRLYCSIGRLPNTFGLYLEIRDRDDTLHARHGCDGVRADVVQWAMPMLRERLKAKHRQTMWVKARTRGRSDLEEFHYVSASHTQGPLIANFGTLLETGIIQVDFLIKIVKSTKGVDSARDKGYLFKIHPRNIGMLFPPSREYQFA